MTQPTPRPTGFAALPKRPPAAWGEPELDDDDEPASSTWGASDELQLILPLPGTPAPQAVFQQPLRIDSFSYGPTRKLYLDNRARKTFVEPPIGVDLKHGFETAVWREEKNEHLDSLLLSLMAGKHATELARTAVVTWRGMMTKLCTAVYAKQDRFPSPWAMNVMLVGTTMYIEEHLSPAAIRKKAEQQADEHQRQMSYIGYSFEQYCCAPSKSNPPPPEAPPGWSGDVNTNEQWCEVVRTKLGDHRIIIAGETDCVKSSGGSVELKTSMQIRNQQDEVRFEQKMLRFYMQSFLLGIPHVLVGFRDHSGMLVAHQEFKTLEMPRLVRGKPHGWNPQYGLDYGARVINWLHDTLSRAHSKDKGDALNPAVWRLELLAPFDQMTLRRLSDEEVKMEVQEGLDDNRAGFLPRKYFDWHNDGFKSSKSASSASSSERRRSSKGKEPIRGGDAP